MRVLVSDVRKRPTMSADPAVDDRILFPTLGRRWKRFETRMGIHTPLEKALRVCRKRFEKVAELLGHGRQFFLVQKGFDDDVIKIA